VLAVRKKVPENFADGKCAHEQSDAADSQKYIADGIEKDGAYGKLSRTAPSNADRPLVRPAA
jgi:hypothetical protein